MKTTQVNTLKNYVAIDSFHHQKHIIAFDSVTALQEAKKTLCGDVLSLTLSE